ncbi:hypothetical protein ACG59Z_01080 [Acinetobacter sp. ABJ_C1_1]|uniref:hypothetical protein n=1 Tax=Acinetobacter sp. ABJ_C1_1 TaxID=3378321 RepID=UPI0037DC5ECF
MNTFDTWWEENYGEFSGQSPQTKRKMNMAYDVGVEHQQAKVEELQKQNAWLSDVAERENKRANKLKEEHVSTTVLLGKVEQQKAELQKRGDSLEEILKKATELVELNIETVERIRDKAKDMHERNYKVSMLYLLKPIRRVLEQALKGEG